MMKEKLEFPYFLDSFRGNPPEESQRITFQNYFPKSQRLQDEATIIQVSTQTRHVLDDVNKKMAQTNVESLLASGKINIYPKKNTIDLKKHLSKKMIKIQKKTQKALALLAKEIIIQKAKLQRQKQLKAI